MQITISERYSFERLLAVLRRYPAHAVFQVDTDAYYRVFRLSDESLALVRVTAADATTLHADVLAASGTVDETILREQIERVLGVNTDLRAFYAYAQTQPTLNDIIAPVRGLPLYRTPTVYEALVFSIIEQHISWVAANKAQQWLVQTYGAALSHDGQTYHAMPTPPTLAALSVDDLKPTKITFRRMERILAISQQVASDELALEALRDASTDAMYTALLAIKGIGHWTAANIVHRARGVYPYLLHNDVALQQAVADYYDTKKSAGRVQETFAQYGDYSGVAAHLVLMRYVLDNYDTNEGNPNDE